MLKCLVVIFVCAAAVRANTTNVVRCTANPGELPLNTHVEGCVNPPCALPQLQDAVIHVVFRAPRLMHSMRTLATAYMPLGPITLPVPYDLGPQAATCDHLTNTYCPVLEHEVTQYTLRMFILELFPVDTVATLEFRVVDQDSVPVFCIRMPFRIDPPVSARTDTLLD